MNEKFGFTSAAKPAPSGKHAVTIELDQVMRMLDLKEKAERERDEADREVSRLSMELRTLREREAARRMDAALAVLRDDDADTVPREAAAAEAWEAMSGCEREQLKQLLFQGPVWDGNVISKGDRSSLIRWGFATRCCFLGEQGYTAATYLGWTVHDCAADKGRVFDRKPGCPG